MSPQFTSAYDEWISLCVEDDTSDVYSCDRFVNRSVGGSCGLAKDDKCMRHLSHP